MVRKDTYRGRAEVRVDTDLQHESDEDDSLTVCYMDQSATHPMRVELLLDGTPCDLEVAAVSILSEKRVKSILPGTKLQQTKVSLRTYTAEKIPAIQVQVQYGQQRKCYVVKGDDPCLMGRDWLKHIRLNWKDIGVTMLDNTLTAVWKVW